MFTKRSTFGILSLFIALILTFSTLGVTPADAIAGIVVNSNADAIADDGLCTLREAITNVNSDSQLYATAGECAAGSGTDTISFAANYTITLVGSQLPAVTTTIIINGNSEANTIIEANAAPNTATYRVFEIYAVGNLTLNSLTVRNGRCSSCATSTLAGGGVYNAGTLTASNVTFSANSVIDSGGGMFNATNSSATLTNVTFSANSAGWGGGMYNISSSATLTNVTFSANFADQEGGGMENYNSSATLTNVTFSGNSASLNGGGMYNYSSSPTLTDVTFSANYADNGGGIYNFNSSSTLTNVTFSGNSATNLGGGMLNAFSSSTLMNVTFSINSAGWGGGMANSGSSPTLMNVTFSINSATAYGGGIYDVHSSPTLTNVTFSANSAYTGGGMDNNNNSSPTLTNVTFSGNSATAGSGGGMYNESSSSPTLTNVIFSANSASYGGGDCYNTSVTLNAASSNNLIEDAANACGLTNGVNGNIIGSDPMLGALANNGGFTQTFALLAGSPAINSGANTGCPATDQRGMTRPQSATCDIGAYEYDLPPIVLSSIRVSASPTNLASVDFTVTFSESVTGVDVGDFSLIASGVSGAAVSGVSGSGSAYTVTVNTGSGDGTIRLDVVDDNSVVDAASYPLGGAAMDDGNFITGEVYMIIKAPTFADVPLSYWSWGYVERLYKAGITGGCTTVPLNYCPTTPVTRAQMAIFLLRGMHGNTYTPPAATGTKFNDVPLGTFGAAWIEQLAVEGITSGCSGGNYCPNTPVSRAQMAIFLVRAKHGIAFIPPTATGLFTDVPVGSFGADYIEQLSADAITSGCGGTNFCPNTTVKRDSMAVFLVKTFNLP